MANEETINETYGISQSESSKTSKLAITSIVFGILGPFSSGAMWIVPCNDFLTIGSPFVIAPFSCGLAWILGLVLGIISLKEIENSEGQLVGREYAIAGILISATWMLLVFIILFLPIIYCVNS